MCGRSTSNAAHNSASGRRQDRRPGRVEQNFVLIAVELTRREAAARSESSKCIGNPRWQVGYVVEGQLMPVAGGDEQITILSWRRPQWCGVGVDKRPKEQGESRLR